MFRLKRPFKALIYDDTKYAYSRNRAAGMSYVNRFLIEEDTQFECAGIVELRVFEGFEVWQYLRNSFQSHLDRFSNKSNSDFICHFILSGDFFWGETTGFLGLWDFMNVNFEDMSYLITHIGSERLECVQKEQYEKLGTEL